MSDDRIQSIEEQGRRLAAAFASSEQLESPSRGPRKLRFALAAAALAVCVVVAVAVVGGRQSGELTLDQAVAAVQEAAFAQPTIPKDRFLHVSTKTTSTGAGGVRYKNGKHGWIHAHTTTADESWTKIGAPRVRRFTTFPQSPISQRDRDNLKRYGRQLFPAKESVCVTRSKRPVRQNDVAPTDPMIDRMLTELPTDPKAAYELLYRRARSAPSVAAGGPAAQVWSAIRFGFMSPGQRLSPSQRSAYLGALAYVPGVTVLKEDRDPLGRRAIGFTRTDDGLRSVVYFDRDTSLVTYIKDTVVSPKFENFGGSNLPRGTTFWAYELNAFEFVDAPPRFAKVHVTNARFPVFCPPSAN